MGKNSVKLETHLHRHTAKEGKARYRTICILEFHTCKNTNVYLYVKHAHIHIENI